MSETKTIALNAWTALYEWLKVNGIEGYDPYHVREMSLYQWLIRWPQLLPLKAIRYPIVRFIETFPSFWIWLFKLQPQIVNKGVGLLASSYLSSYRSISNEDYLVHADKCFNYLLENPSKGYSGYCWGYPFDWKMVNSIPKYTPSSVVSTHIGHAFWERYRTFNNHSDLDVCESICDFLIGDLNLDEISADKVCFSYTPIDSSHILNASLFASEFLIRVGSEIGNSDWVETGKRGINYVLSNQNPDGSFWYYGREDEGRYAISERTYKKIDSYHTGFILRMLDHANQILIMDEISNVIQKGFDFYINRFLDKRSGKPYTDIAIHRNKINIHGCAEALLVLNRLSRYNEQSSGLLLKVLQWIIENMQDRSGYFYFEKTPLVTKKVAYLRWGQSWMARALTELIENNEKSD